MKVRTEPGPSSEGMGGELYGRQDGQPKGPYPVTGP